MAKKKKFKTISFETFQYPDNWSIEHLERDEPSAFNMSVEVERFSVTIKKIEESKEVLQKRLQDLYDGADNHHLWSPIEREANRLGVELKPRKCWQDK